MRSLHALSAVIATLLIGAIGTFGAEAAVQSHPAPLKATTQASGRICPKGIRPLPASGVQRAADKALAGAARLYPGLNTRGAEVMAADRSAFAGARGREVRNLCGKKVAARTVVVQMLFPRMLPSASLSQSVVFVGRFAHGYRVWHVAH
jgi:hypothetical protein